MINEEQKRETIRRETVPVIPPGPVEVVYDRFFVVRLTGESEAFNRIPDLSRKIERQIDELGGFDVQVSEWEERS